jgi:serine/threonine protein phosphatase PrpC
MSADSPPPAPVGAGRACSELDLPVEKSGRADEAHSRLRARITTHTLARDKDEPGQDACDAQFHRDAIIGALADGVGGSGMGREAAAKTIECFLRYFKSRPPSWSIRKALDEFVKLINRSLYQESMARFERPELLSTAAVAVLEGDRLQGLNVGDSRVYLFRRGELKQLSVDHAGSQPDFQHVLSRGMGMEPDVAPHCFEHVVGAGDVVLLCSDGITRVLPDDELRELLAGHLSARGVVRRAREKATDETLDDMSAVVIEVQEINPAAIAGQARLKIPDRLEAGQHVDGFTLKQPFKTNERIWVATRDGKPFALKFAPLKARDNEEVHSQFVREMWTATRLQADYFAQAFVPERQSFLYYVQEYFPVPTLKHFIEEKPLDAPEAVALGKFLLSASQFLLRFDFVHGDLKPENILVFKHGGQLDFKLIDFGSVTEVFSATSRAGTPSYLAPERFHSAPIAERTEVFALGVTVFEALTRAFPYGEIEQFQTPVFRTPHRPSKLNVHLPPWLESVLLRAVAADPEARYQTYSEMKFDLENPQQVRPFYGKGAPLLERNPVLFYKVGFFALLVFNLYLLARMLSEK